MLKVSIPLIVAGAISLSVWAEAPVVDLNDPARNAVTGTADGDTALASSAPVTVTPAVNTEPQPVVASNDVSGLSPQDRLSRLEQQMTNLINMNLPQQVSDMQQQVAQIRGQLQVQERDLQTLSTQQKNFYQDLTQQISQLKNATPSAAPSASIAPTTNSTAPVATSAASASDASTYQAAFAYLTKKQYDQALPGLKNYLTRYPKGQYADNAHYWLGQIYYGKKQYPEATQEFTAVIKQFPKSSKVPDAKLQLAIIHANTNQVAQAKKELEQIKKDYPGTTAAQLATIRLQQLSN